MKISVWQIQRFINKKNILKCSFIVATPRTGEAKVLIFVRNPRELHEPDLSEEKMLKMKVPLCRDIFCVGIMAKFRSFATQA